MGGQVQCSNLQFWRMVLADIKHITNQKLAIRNQEQKVEGMWIGKTTNNGEHIIALKSNGGSIYYTRSFSRMTPDQQWSKELFNTIEVPMMDTTLQPEYSEEAVIGTAIIDQYFTKVRLKEKQAGHNLWANKKEVHNPPDMYNELYNEQPQLPADDLEPIQWPPGLKPPHYVHPTSKAIAKPAAYKPTYRLNNEDQEEKNRMESLMDNVQVQLWWQYENDVTKYNVKDIELGMNNEIR
eukprot:2862311-Amphidinium_carterae.7